MTNLFTGELKTNNNYELLSELTGITFLTDNSYVIQFRDPAYIREGETGKGFYIFDNQPFQYTAGIENLYINTGLTVCRVNIAS